MELSLREYFAGQALVGILIRRDDMLSNEMVAKQAWSMADAMLAAHPTKNLDLENARADVGGSTA